MKQILIKIQILVSDTSIEILITFIKKNSCNIAYIKRMEHSLKLIQALGNAMQFPGLSVA